MFVDLYRFECYHLTWENVRQENCSLENAQLRGKFLRFQLFISYWGAELALFYVFRLFRMLHTLPTERVAEINNEVKKQI